MIWYPYIGICGTELIGMSVLGFRILGGVAICPEYTLYLMSATQQRIYIRLDNNIQKPIDFYNKSSLSMINLASLYISPSGLSK